ncbi:amidohydrolase family protein [Lentzea sp. PSKA42]|uniref:Amidohydrolase family protein n=1 Tax=Lentzea indica TaxID=2604800 RepID=A0ABX1FE56_9PSEU|nr:amidohydrolase family protein [Lentzea indica]NKE57220.1 amidohydrolase family protein [Lentzea indica]
MRRVVPLLLGCLAVLNLPPDTVSPAAPDVIYHHGVVLTMEATRQQAEAIAVLRDRIVAVGDDRDVLPLAGRTTRVVDLEGRTVMPGFLDSHAHWIGDGEMVGYWPEAAVDAALRRGWTSISEQFVDDERLARLRELDRSGALRLRVNAYLPVNFEDDKFGGWYLGLDPRRSYSPHLRLAGVKLFLDHDWGTRFHWSQAQLNDYVRVAHRNGWQVSAHAISAQALDQYLTAVAEALAGHPSQNARHRVEHAVQLRDDQLARMRELGLIASIQPGLPGDSAKEPGFGKLVARGQTGWIARWRDLVDSDVRTIGSTDMPWLVLVLGGHATELQHGSPLEAVHQAVTRQSYLGRAPEDWQLAQRLTVDQALRLFTIDAAYGTFEEDVKGSLAPGKYADLVILSDNPTSVAVDALPGIRVLATVVGGKVEHCADEQVCSSQLRS